MADRPLILALANRCEIMPDAATAVRPDAIWEGRSDFPTRSTSPVLPVPVPGALDTGATEITPR